MKNEIEILLNITALVDNIDHCLKDKSAKAHPDYPTFSRLLKEVNHILYRDILDFWLEKTYNYVRSVEDDKHKTADPERLL